MSWNDQFGNFPCCHISCEKEADFIIGTNAEDYGHFCIDHVDEYWCEDERKIPIIRGVKAIRE